MRSKVNIQVKGTGIIAINILYHFNIFSILHTSGNIFANYLIMSIFI